MRFASRVRRVVASLFVSTGFLAAPGAMAQNCTPFTDVPASDPFCANIQWMFNRGVTLGCGTNQYCPADYVRRDQMAAFMNRLGDTVQARVTGTCAVGSYVRAIAADGNVTCGTDNSGPAGAFVQNGNTFGAPAVLGSNDPQPLDLRAGGARVARYEPGAVSPNVIAGSPANGAFAGVRGATIAGGGVPAGNTDPDFGSEAPNRVVDHYGTVGGGYGHIAGNDDGALGSGVFATVAGGLSNEASGSVSSIGGGNSNTVTGQGGVIGGGSLNTVSDGFAVVAGGGSNLASGGGAAVGGGFSNTASGESAVVPGGSGNTASGLRSLAAGSASEARGDYSVAIGRRAKTFLGANPGLGTIVLADSSDFDFAESIDNRFAVRAVGGMRFVTQIDASGDPARTMFLANTGNLNVEGTVNSLSDRNAKTGLEPVDAAGILQGVLALPIASWSYSTDPAVRHLGPTAQDFRRVFDVGESERSIATVDADGVALAAIQGLNAKLEAEVREQQARLAEQARTLAAQGREIAALRAAVEALAREAPRPAHAGRARTSQDLRANIHGSPGEDAH